MTFDDIDLDAIIAESARTRDSAASSNRPAKAPDTVVRLDTKSDSATRVPAAPEEIVSLSASIRALATSPALPRLLERLAAWIESHETAGS